VIPKIDSDIGILHYTTKFAGVGGRIRQKFEDFAVSEVLSERALASLSGDDGFAVYRLTKSGIDTNHALDRISQKFGARLKALGLKDSSAVTEQYVCSMARGRTVPKYSDEKISLEKIGFSKKPLSAKDMRGNRFRITITEPNSDVSQFAEHDRVLNFYGYQRFGSKRPVTHLVGRALLKRQFADAVNLFLSFASEYDSDDNTKLRHMMADPSRYSEALQSIPKQMDLERILMREMLEHSDPQKAISKLPLSIRRLLVDAYQSYLFNLALSASYGYGEELFAPQQGDVCYNKSGTVGKYEMDPDQHLAVPLVGYSYYKKTRFDFHISKVLEQEEISPKDFYFKEMQELSTEGGFRTSSLVCDDYAAKDNVVSFTLQRGSFATILMREIMKTERPLEAGF